MPSTSQVDLSSVIQVVKNPGKKGLSAARFALYRTGMTVREYKESVLASLGKSEASKALPDIHWDHAHGFITLNGQGHAAPEVSFSGLAEAFAAPAQAQALVG